MENIKKNKRLSITAGIAVAALAVASVVVLNIASNISANPVNTVAQISSPAPSDINRQVAQLPAEMAVAIQRDLKISPAEYIKRGAISASLDAVQPKLQAVGIPASASWLDESTVYTHVTNDIQRSTAASVGSTPTNNNPPVNDVKLNARTTTGLPPANPGSAFTVTQNDGSKKTCSIGFFGTWSSGGSPYTLSAGHCWFGGTSTPSNVYLNLQSQQSPGDSGNPVATLGFYTNGKYGGGNDYGFVHQATVATPYSAGTTPQWSPVGTFVRGYTTAATGAPICKSGATTGWTCGTISAVNQSVTTSDGATVNSITSNVCVFDGDSGGPALTGSYAIGITSSTTATSANCQPGSQGNFYPLRGANGSNSVEGQTYASGYGHGWQPIMYIDTPINFSYGYNSTSGNMVFTATLPNCNSDNTNSAYIYLNGNTNANAIQDTGYIAGPSCQIRMTTTASSNFAVGQTVTYKLYGTFSNNSESVPATGSFVWGTSAPTPTPTTPIATPPQSTSVTPIPSSDTPTPTPTPTVTDSQPPSSSAPNSINGMIDRLSGPGRFDTSVSISSAGWPSGANNIVIASGITFPDALSVSALAAKLSAPILLTPPDQLLSVTSFEIQRLVNTYQNANPSAAIHIYIAGGVNAVSQNVVTGIQTALAPNNNVTYVENQVAQ